MTESENKALIDYFFTPKLIKQLYYHAMRVDIEDNNEKAELIIELLGPEFIELGTGTNRIAVLKNGFVCKIALDYRGRTMPHNSLNCGDELDRS